MELLRWSTKVGFILKENKPMKRSPLFFFLCLLGGLSNSFSQNAPDIFILPKQLQWVNPSQVGWEQKSSAGIHLHSQWLGIDNAPKQSMVYYENYQEKNNLSYGFVLRNNTTFGENNTAVYLQFSKPIQLSQTMKLILGIQGGGNFYDQNFNYFNSVDGVVDDPLLEPQNIFVPNIGVGGILSYKSFSFSSGLPQLFKKNIFRKDDPIFLPNRIAQWYGLEWRSNLAPLWEHLFSLQLHNLSVSDWTLQAKAGMQHQRGAGFLVINSEKEMAFGLLFHEKRFLSVGYSFQFPLVNDTGVRFNKHQINFRFRFRDRLP